MKIGKLKNLEIIPPMPTDILFHCPNLDCPTAKRNGYVNITKIALHGKTREEIMELYVPKCPVCNKFMKL
jgi:hypothetical protein